VVAQAQLQIFWLIQNKDKSQVVRIFDEDGEVAGKLKIKISFFKNK
jgi:hypothetical protein